MDLKPGTDIQQLTRLLAERFPHIENQLAAAIKAVNREFAAEDLIIPDGAEVAFFPPVSGGAHRQPILLITARPLSCDELSLEMSSDTAGAICCFSGVVRRKTVRGKEQETDALYYEAYESMALEKMRQIAREIHEQWQGIEQVGLVQRIGLLQAGEVSTLIACSGAHRDSGIFEAVSYGINRFKEIVPVWKKEITEKDQRWVTGEYRPAPGE